MSTRSLPPELLVAIADGGGLVRATDCRRLGVSQDRIDRLLRNGRLVALAKGVYAAGTEIAGLRGWPLFELQSRAFVIASPSDTYASDWSAVALHGMPTKACPPQVPSVIRLGSRASGSNLTVHGRTRFASVPDRWLTDVGGVRTVRPAFTAIDIGRGCDRRMGLMLADATAARDGSRESLAQALQDMAAWPRIKHARWAAINADPDVESALESAGRFAFFRVGLAPSQSNVWVGDGFPRYRLDHYWSECRLAAEADGLGKYHLSDPVEAMRREKEREWHLQEWGIRVVRYTWQVALAKPDALANRCATMMQAEPLPASRTVQTWPRLVGYQMLGITPPFGR